jgi:hypothetical protein
MDFLSGDGLFAREPSSNFLATEYGLSTARAAGDTCPGSSNPLSLVVASGSPGMLVGAYWETTVGRGFRKLPRPQSLDSQ